MNKIIFISGPCGSGKSTFADAYARYLSDQENKTIYVIHGDDFHQGFVEPEDKEDFFVGGQASDPVLWSDILKFNWDCIISTAGRALDQGLDVVIDYVIEEEFPRIQDLAESHDAKLHYIVLTASEDELTRRIIDRGDTDMIERAIFLKNELETKAENQGHLLETTGKDLNEMIHELNLEEYLVK